MPSTHPSFKQKCIGKVNKCSDTLTCVYVLSDGVARIITECLYTGS